MYISDPDVCLPGGVATSKPLSISQWLERLAPAPSGVQKRLASTSLPQNGVFGNYQLELADNATGGLVHDDEQ
jgi:hypothetical protein